MDPYSRTGIMLAFFGLVPSAGARITHDRRHQLAVWRFPPPWARSAFGGSVDQIDILRLMRFLASLALVLFGILLAITGTQATHGGPLQAVLGVLGVTIALLVGVGVVIVIIRDFRKD